MLDILSLLQCLILEVETTTLKRMSIVITALLGMSGRVTMKGISRWAGKGGSYRTIQRFFNTVLPWPTLLWTFFCHHCWRSQDTYVLAGDESVITKSGKKTYGLGRFFSSLQNQSVLGLSFFCLSLVSVEQETAFPVRLEQQLPVPLKPKSKANKKKGLRKGGRPKGSSNKDKTQVNLTAELRLIRGMIEALLTLMGTRIPLQYLLLDGHFGHNNAMQMARQLNLHLISKLRYDSKLFFPYQGNDGRRKYGERINPRKIPEQYRVESSLEKGIRTDIYHLRAKHQSFASALNLVILLKTNLETQQQVHVILFSSDLSLEAPTLIKYYSLRFQIEFNFRDAKQFWGLEDFMNTSPTGVLNAANLSFLMVNLSFRLLQQMKFTAPDYSILDLKAFNHGQIYVREVLKYLPRIPDPILLQSIFTNVSNLGAIHPILSSDPTL